MSDTFDPYHKWLGIPPKDQPPHHYRLLGITLFEADREVIEAAANRQMSYLQELSSGAEQIDEAQKLLGEVSRARVCLRDAEKKNEYDAQLREELRAANEEFVAEEFSVETATFADGDGPTAEPPAVAEGIPAFPGSGPDAEAGGRPLIPLPDGMEALPHTTAHPRGKKQNPMPLIVLAVVALVLVGGGITFYLTGEAKEQEQQRLAQAAEKNEAHKETDRQTKQSRQRAAAEKRAKRKAAREAAERKAAEETKRQAEEETKRQAEEETKRQAEEEAERKAKAAAEQQAREEAASDAEQAMADRKLERKDKNDVKTWFLRNEQASEYDKLQSQRDSEQIEKLDLLRNALLKRYTELADDDAVKDSLQRLGGTLATVTDLPFWPDEVRDALKEEGLQERDADEGNFWILAAELNFLEKLEQLESQKDAIFELRKKGSDKTKAKEKAKEFGKELETTKALYASLGEKYEELNSDTELIAKIESLGDRLGPTLTDKAWTKQQKRFTKVVKTPSRTKSGGRMPRRIFSSNTILQLDGTDATQDAITGQIAQPPTITAEVVVQVNKGIGRKAGSIIGQALDNNHIEQGWELGYGRNNFEFRIGTHVPGVGGRFHPVPVSKTTLKARKVCHVVGTYDGIQAKLYINGVLESTTPKKMAIKYPNAASSPFTIGAHKDSDEYFELDGTIYLVRVYAGALNAKQVVDRYNEVKKKIDELNNAP